VNIVEIFTALVVTLFWKLRNIAPKSVIGCHCVAFFAAPTTRSMVDDPVVLTHLTHLIPINISLRVKAVYDVIKYKKTTT
jgi:hypothetical protein